MFIKTKYAGYNRHGEQIAAGLFLILTQPKTSSPKYPMMSATCAKCGAEREVHDRAAAVVIPACEVHGVIARIRAKQAAGLDVPDSDLAEVTAEGCAQCKAHNDALQAAGCRYFQPAMIDYPIRAIVRHTSLRQLGNFMMGCARVHGCRVTLSGSYGGDGLPCHVPDEVYELGLELPMDLRAAWNGGGGWNGAGNEAPAMRLWALKNLAELRK